MKPASHTEFLTAPSELLLAESYKGLSDISSGPAARPIAFPFEKKMGVSARAIFDRWTRKSEEQPFKQPYPDLAIRAPYRIVFEGKYFRSGSQDYAERQLVSAICSTWAFRKSKHVAVPGRSATPASWHSMHPWTARCSPPGIAWRTCAKSSGSARTSR